MLQELHTRLGVRSQRLIVVSPAGAPPRRMLELTALDVTIAVRDTLADATELLTAD